MLESLIVFSAGAASITALVLAAWLVNFIIDYRDRRRSTYIITGKAKLKDGASPDLQTYPVKIQKIKKGYIVKFFEDGRVVYAITLSKVD